MKWFASKVFHLNMSSFFLLAQVLHWLWLANFTYCAPHYLSREAQVPLQDRTGAARGMGTWAVFVSHQCAIRPANLDIDALLFCNRTHDFGLRLPLLLYRMAGD